MCLSIIKWVNNLSWCHLLLKIKFLLKFEKGEIKRNVSFSSNTTKKLCICPNFSHLNFDLIKSFT